MPDSRPTRTEFTEFAREMEPRLRYALTACMGSAQARDAAQEALIYAWEHWEKMQTVDNPAGYLYRLAKRRAWRAVKRQPRMDPLPPEEHLTIEPRLVPALEQLSKMQRQVVYLVEGLGMSQRETAGMLGVGRTTVETHLQRAMARLREELGVPAS